MGSGHQLRSVTLGDTPAAWSALGFAVRELPDGSGSVALGSTEVVLTGTGDGVEGWSVDGVDEPIEHLPLVPAPAPPSDAGAPGPHPNGIDSIDHVVVRTGDVERTTRALEAVGIEARGGRSTSSYGAPMRQVFFWLGDVILELVGPEQGEPTTDAPTTVFGLALVAPDLDATLEALGDLAGSPGDAVQPGRRIAGIRGTQAGVSLPLAVMSPHRPN
jgi:hypothetical protein